MSGPLSDKEYVYLQLAISSYDNKVAEEFLKKLQNSKKNCDTVIKSLYDQYIKAYNLDQEMLKETIEDPEKERQYQCILNTIDMLIVQFGYMI